MTQPCPAMDIATSDRSALRQAIRTAYLADEAEAVVRFFVPLDDDVVQIPVDRLVDGGRHSMLGEQARTKVHRDDFTVDEDAVVIEDDEVEGSG